MNSKRPVYSSVESRDVFSPQIPRSTAESLACSLPHKASGSQAITRAAERGVTQSRDPDSSSPQ